MNPSLIHIAPAAAVRAEQIRRSRLGIRGRRRP